MIEVGVIERSGNFVASVLHLPTNILKKASSKSADKAVAICLDEVLDEVKNKNWLMVSLDEDNKSNISINSLYSLFIPKDSGFCPETFLEHAGIKMLSIHVFERDGKKYTAYSICSTTSALLENLLSIQGVELDCS